MNWIVKGIAWIAGFLAVAGAVGAAVVYLGLYDISATDQHTKPVYYVIETTMRRSVHRRAQAVHPPDLSSPALFARGLHLYHQHCVQCHGAPGVAPQPFALGMRPVPANLVETARRWSPAEIYGTIRRGIKMTGMPAWEFRLADDDMWAITAFVDGLPALSPVRYREMLADAADAPRRDTGGTTTGGPPRPTPDGDTERGRLALSQYACITCHVIPGITGATHHVGPPLAGIARRQYLAGMLRNTPENLIYWIRHPQRVDPRSAMPDLGVTEADARDMAAYLLSLDAPR